MPDDQKMTESREVQPVMVTTLGTGDGSRLPRQTEVETPGAHQPNIVITVVTPLGMILVRGLKAFVVTWVSLLPTAGATHLVPFTDFWDLLTKTCGLAAGAGIGAGLAALGEVLTRLDQKFPTWTA